MNNITKGKILIRKLGLMAPNLLTPKVLANKFQSCLASSKHINFTGLNSVGNGEGYIGLNKTGDVYSTTKIAIIGKGITFDSGGLNIKPSKSMSDMKFDMLGAATVLSLTNTLSSSPYNITLLGCIAENTFGRNMNRPGDVITYPNGTKVEIDNTDAEGRLVLADGILHAKAEHPDLIITIATLTGAARVALGEATALFSNHRKITKKFLNVATNSNEEVWQLPIFPHHKKAIKGQRGVSDIVNCSDIAGASTAAAFLEHFIGEVPWIHLDIAGSAYKNKIPTGVMLETLTNYLMGELL